MLSTTALTVLFYRVVLIKCEMDVVSNRKVRFERALEMYAPHLNQVADLWCKITEEGINLNRQKK